MGKRYAGAIDRWADTVSPKRWRKQDKRTGAEIAQDVIKRAGLVVV